MFCKKCGTEQKDGQKYCPKCGEPFLDENGKPYLKGIKKDIQDAKDKVASKAEEFTQHGKKLIDEKVQPQLNDKIEELKNVDWDGKKTETVKTMETFFSNTDKLRTATIWIAVIAVLWFFIFNHGFSASWTWWLFAVVFIVAAFYRVKTNGESDALMKARCSFALAIFLGLIFVFSSPSHSSLGSVDDSEIDYKANNAQEEETLMKMAKIRGEISSILPQVEALYNAHQQHLARGFQYASSPAWGKWQDCNRKIDDLWNEYMRLARQLDDSDDIIEEARESKRKMDKAFEQMFGMNY